MFNLNDLATLLGQQQQLLRSPPQAAPDLPEITRLMMLPDDLVGCVIGRGGSKINSIRRESQAFIKIADAEEGSNLRRITIKGNPDSVRSAVDMINYT
ncbi:unnamed protein product [Mesocestoides corti]|uniref:K Homology domain-containing protein n=1 Tax=Mesocestoides corti TaxID=53468 RepID=A0A0R3UG86_MESCO|nr:unnamed protein product [Mesocestoides corti]